VGRAVKLLGLLGVVILLGGAIKIAEDAPVSPVAVALPADAGKAETPCTPGDQDQYVYLVQRLQVLKPCLHVTGTVDFRNVEDDGDVHLDIRPDPRYQALLVDGNKYERGDLIVEPVCQALPMQADAMRLCASDVDRLQSLPQVGDHVWMEGRYVLDIEHNGWSELHPLYRWGKAN